MIRSYREGDEVRINEMFNEVFGQRRDLGSWYWKYRDNPRGRYVVSLAVAGDGMLAAHYGAYPALLCCPGNGDVQGRDLTILQVGDKMTRDRYRSLGFGRSSLLSRTVRHFRDTYTPGTLFSYGFVTHHSLRFGLLILDYVMIEKVPYGRIQGDRLRALRPGGLADRVRGLEVRQVSTVDESWSRFFDRCAPHYGCLVKRDAPHMKWRYLERPGRSYFLVAVTRRSQLAGWSVFHRRGDRLVWGDALFLPGDHDAVRVLLAFARDHPLSKGIDAVEGWFPARPGWWGSALECVGFTREPEPHDLHLCIANFTDPSAPEIARERFYYTGGDSDLF